MPAGQQKALGLLRHCRKWAARGEKGRSACTLRASDRTRSGQYILKDFYEQSWTDLTHDRFQIAASRSDGCATPLYGFGTSITQGIKVLENFVIRQMSRLSLQYLRRNELAITPSLIPNRDKPSCWAGSSSFASFKNRVDAF